MTAPDERDVELLPDDDPPDDEPIAEETTNPAIERELLLAGLGEEVDRKENPLDAIGEAARDNPDAIDALLEGLDEIGLTLAHADAIAEYESRMPERVATTALA